MPSEVANGLSTCASGVSSPAGTFPGSLNLELGGNLTTYLGWLVPWEGELVLLSKDPAEIDEARRLIARSAATISRARHFGERLNKHRTRHSHAGGRPLSSYPVASFADLAHAWSEVEASGIQVLDVRHRHEWQAGHLRGARHLALPELLEHRSEVPTTVQVWVHCAGGFRAAAAASILSGWGASPVCIDDSWESARQADLPIVSTGS